MPNQYLRRYVWSTLPPYSGRRNIHISAGFNSNGSPLIGPGCPNVALSGSWKSCDDPWETPDDATLCPHCFKKGRLREWEERCEREASGLVGEDA
jgi:hypothetical protein